MRVLLCERSSLGHRMVYLKNLTQISEIEFFSYAPQNTGLDVAHFFQNDFSDNKSLHVYLKWIRKIKAIVKEKKIDVVHILDGDSIMRFFGLGFSIIGAKKIVITYHHLFDGFLRRVSYRTMNRRNKAVSVVHTASIQQKLRKKGVRNVELCQYPAFNFEALSTKDVQKCKESLGLEQTSPVIGIVGGMSRYKKIVEFLEIMNKCKRDFQVLLCGKPGDVTVEQLKEAVKGYSEKAVMFLRILSDDEYEMAIVASDIIYCIYSHEFNGASGPLTDGVCAKKMILGCKHGSLGEIIKVNHLGCVAEVDDKAEVLKTTEKALEEAKSFRYDEVAIKYRNNLKPDKFLVEYEKIYTKV